MEGRGVVFRGKKTVDETIGKGGDIDVSDGVPRIDNGAKGGTRD